MRAPLYLANARARAARSYRAIKMPLPLLYGKGASTDADYSGTNDPCARTVPGLGKAT